MLLFVNHYWLADDCMQSFATIFRATSMNLIMSKNINGIFATMRNNFLSEANINIWISCKLEYLLRLGNLSIAMNM